MSTSSLSESSSASPHSSLDTARLCEQLALISVPLSLGAKGPAVSLLQKALRLAGFFHRPHITGQFGSITHASVRDFQLFCGVITHPRVKGSGVLGPRTKAALLSFLMSLKTPDVPAVVDASSVTAFPIDVQSAVFDLLGDVARLVRERLGRVVLDSADHVSGSPSPLARLENLHESMTVQIDDFRNLFVGDSPQARALQRVPSHAGGLLRAELALADLESRLVTLQALTDAGPVDPSSVRKSAQDISIARTTCDRILNELSVKNDMWRFVFDELCLLLSRREAFAVAPHSPHPSCVFVNRDALKRAAQDGFLPPAYVRFSAAYITHKNLSASGDSAKDTATWFQFARQFVNFAAGFADDVIAGLHTFFDGAYVTADQQLLMYFAERASGILERTAGEGYSLEPAGDSDHIVDVPADLAPMAQVCGDDFITLYPSGFVLLSSHQKNPNGRPNLPPAVRIVTR